MTEGAISFMKKMLWLGFVQASLTCCPVYGQDEEVKEVPITDVSVREAIVAPLDGCDPLKGGAVQSHVSKDGQYALYGDIFGNGPEMALTQFSAGAGFCEWKDNRWEVVKAWNISVTWKKDGTKGNSLEERTSGNPVDRAFWTLGIGNNRSAVVAAGEQDRSWQVFYVFQLNTNKNIPELVAQSMREWPRYRDGYVVMNQDSGRRSTWGTSLYYKVNGWQLLHVVDWYENAEDPEAGFEIVSHYNSNGQLAQAFMLQTAKSPNPNLEYEVYQITTSSQNSTFSEKDRFIHSKVWADIRFKWPKQDEPDPESAELELAYMFEKLTGLSRECYPNNQFIESKRRLEAVATVQVKGDKNAVERLSPSRENKE